MHLQGRGAAEIVQKQNNTPSCAASSIWQLFEWLLVKRQNFMSAPRITATLARCSKGVCALLP
jgi:hypothetical protein